MAFNNLKTDYATYIKDSNDFYTKIDINQPTNNVIDQNLSHLQVPNFTTEMCTDVMGKFGDWMTKYCKLKDDIVPDGQAAALTEDEIKQELNEIGNTLYAGFRMCQQRTHQGYKKQQNKSADEEPLLISLPNFGAQQVVDATNMKTLNEFSGDRNLQVESDNLRKFLRDTYAICRGKVTEEGCRSAILRKLSGTAQRLSIIQKLMAQ